MTTTFFFFFLLLLAAAAATATTETTDSAITYRELESMHRTLRIRGYTLFSNAITTTDLQFKLLTTAAAADDARTEMFTLFCPGDSQLFSLDMTSDAKVYIDTLHYHVIPHRRLTFPELQSLSASFLDTLLPHYSILIGKTENDSVALNNNGGSSIGVMVDGVRVSVPDLFVGWRFAVHGIDDILVTGLNKYPQDLEENDDNGLGFASPATSPEEFQMPEFEQGVSVPVPPPMTHIDPNIWVWPSSGNLAPMTQYESMSPAPFDEEALPPQLAGNGPVKEPVKRHHEKSTSMKKRMKRRRIHLGRRRKNRHRNHHHHHLEDL